LVVVSGTQSCFAPSRIDVRSARDVVGTGPQPYDLHHPGEWRPPVADRRVGRLSTAAQRVPRCQWRDDAPIEQGWTKHDGQKMARVVLNGGGGLLVTPFETG
jgi:hypothetical protein